MMPNTDRAHRGEAKGRSVPLSPCPLVPLSLGLAVVLAAGWIHGLWTQRWSKSADLEAAVARLGELPGDLEGWKAEPGTEDREALAAAGAEGWWIRRYVQPYSGAHVDVLLLCGPSGRLCVHRPEHCYSGAGYELAAPATHFSLPGGEFWMARFTKEDLSGPVTVRIFWSWFANGTWQAPSNPRWSLAHAPALYKLYVLREEPPGPPGRVEDDPAAEFLRILVPALSRALDPPVRP
jgi:hypothetical protein